MDIEQLSPQLRELLRSTPRQDLLLRYWREILEKSPEELRDQRTCELESGTAYRYVSRAAVNPGYEAWFRGVLPEAGITVLPGALTSRSWPSRRRR
jgi:hypothetical protein